MTTEPIAVDVPKSLAGLAGPKPGPTLPALKPGDKPDAAKPADGNASATTPPAPGSRTFVGWIAASVTKKQLKIGAAALCSLVAGVAAVRLIWPANDEKPPERTAQLLLSEPQKASPTPDNGPRKPSGPSIEVVKQPEPTIPATSMPTSPPHWGLGGSPAVPATPGSSGSGLPPVENLANPVPPSGAPMLPAIPPVDPSSPAGPARNGDTLPPPDAGAFVVPASGATQPGATPPGGGTGNNTGSGVGAGGIQLPALPSAPSSTPPTTPPSPGLPNLPTLPPGPVAPSIAPPEALGVGFGSPKSPTEPKTDPKVEPKSSPTPVSGLPPLPTGPISVAPPPGPGATTGTLPPPANLNEHIAPVPPPSSLVPSVTDKPAETPRIEITKPANSTVVTPISGNVPERTPTTSYDVDIYHPKAGDTYQSISSEFFNDPKYAAALQAYNKNKLLTGGGTVDVPPIHVLKRLAVPQSQPGVGAGTPMPVSRSPAASDPWVAAGTSNGNTYRVPRGGTSLTAVAKSLLGSEQRWRDLYDLNPHVTDPNNVPEGTELKLPANARGRE